jgi:hypothetical protein
MRAAAVLRLLLCALLFECASASVSAQALNPVTYQGKITIAGAPAGQPVDLIFSLYSEPESGFLI